MQKGTKKYTKKKTGLIIFSIVSAIILALGGGGFCVYWFLLRKDTTSLIIKCTTNHDRVQIQKTVATPSFATVTATKTGSSNELTGNWTLSSDIPADTDKFTISNPTNLVTDINYDGGALTNLSNETLTLTFSGTDTYAGITGKCEIELIFEALESLFTIKTAEWGDAQSNLGPGQILNYAMLSNYKVYDTYDPSFNDPTKINGINFCLGQSESLNVPDYSYVEKPDGSIDYTLTDVSSVYDSYVGIVNLKNTVPSTKLNLDNVFVKNKPTSATKERQYNFYDLGGNHFISTPSVNDILLEWNNNYGSQWQSKFQTVNFDQLEIESMTSANNGSVVLKPKATSARYSGGSVTFTNFSYDV